MNVHIPSGKAPIFAFSTPRAGSTYLLELLAMEPGLKVYNEALSIARKATAKELGVWDWRSATVLAERETIYGVYFNKLLNNQIPQLNTPLYRRNGRFLTNRIAFKILHGGEDMIPWFARTFEAQILILIRHPIPTTLSHKQFPRLPHFLDQAAIRRRLSPARRRLVEKVVERGDHFDKGIVNWCLHYFFVLGPDRCSDWLFLPYEDLVLRPTQSIQYLSEALGLQGSDRMLQVVNRPSLSTNQSNKDVRELLNKLEHNGSPERQTIVERWKSQVDQTMERRAFYILETFGIDFYEYDRLTPLDRYRIGEESVAVGDAMVRTRTPAAPP